MNHAILNDAPPPPASPPSPKAAKTAGAFGASFAAGAILVSSCCAVPLALSMVGLGGAWLGELTALAPYKSYFLAAAALALAGGWAVLLWRWRAARPCPPGGACAPASRAWPVVLILALATKLVVLAAVWASLDTDLMQWLMRMRAA